jgi:plastocyanin
MEDAMRMMVYAGVLTSLLVPAAAWSNPGPQVTIDNFTFSPATLTIARGTTVTWTNQDDIPHSIVLGGTGVHSKALDTENSFSYQFDRAGTFAYICGLHPHMHGEVIVR